LPVARILAEMLLVCAGLAIQYSLRGEVEGLGNNLHKRVGEAVEAFAKKDLLGNAKYNNIWNWSGSAISKRFLKNSDPFN